MKHSWNIILFFVFLYFSVEIARTTNAQSLGPNSLLRVAAAPQGVVSDPVSTCHYVIFRFEVQMQCENIATGGSRSLTTIIDNRILGGAAIVNWVDRITASGHLVLVTRQPNSRFGSLLATRLSRGDGSPFFIGDVEVLVSDELYRTPSDIFLAEDDSTIFFVGLNSNETNLIQLRLLASNTPVISGRLIEFPREAPLIAPSFASVSPFLFFRVNTETEPVIVRYNMSTVPIVLFNSTIWASPSNLSYTLPTSICGPVRINATTIAFSFTQPNTIETLWSNSVASNVLFVFTTFDSVDRLSIRCTGGRSSYYVIYKQAQDGFITVLAIGDMSQSDAMDLASSEHKIYHDGDYNLSPIITVGDELLAYAAGINRLSATSFTGTVAVAGPAVFFFGYTSTSTNVSSVMFSVRNVDDFGLSPSAAPNASLVCEAGSPRGLTLSAAGTFTGERFLVAYSRADSNVLLAFKTNFLLNTSFVLSATSDPSPIAQLMTGARIVGKIAPQRVLIESKSIAIRYGPILLASLQNASAQSFALNTLSYSGAANECIREDAAILIASSPNSAIVIFATYPDELQDRVYFKSMDATTGLVSDGFLRNADGDALFLTSQDIDLLKLQGRQLPVAFSDFSEEYIILARVPFEVDSTSRRFDGLNPTSSTSYTCVEPLTGSWTYTITSTRFVWTARNQSNLCILDLNFQETLLQVSQISVPFSGLPTLLESLSDGTIVAAPRLNVASSRQILPPGAQTTMPIVTLIAIDHIVPIPINSTVEISVNFAAGEYTARKCFNSYSACLGGVATLCSACTIRTINSLGDIVLVEANLISEKTFAVYAINASGIEAGPRSFPVLDRDFNVVSSRIFGSMSVIASEKRVLVLKRVGDSLQTRVFDPELLSWQKISQIEVIEDDTGVLSVLATIEETSSLSWEGTAQRVLILPFTLCDSRCPSGFVCQNMTCEALDASPAIVSAPIAIVSCPLPPPAANAVCINGTYVIVGNFSVATGSVNVSVPLVVNGSLQLGPGATLVFQTGGTITVSDCIQLGGELVVTLPTPTQSVSSSVGLITFDGGYCNGERTRFMATNITFQDAPTCARTSNNVIYGERLISLAFTFDTSSCAPSEAAVVGGLSAGAIAGITVAAVVLVAAVIALVLFFKFRGKIAPYAQRQQDGGAVDDAEL